MTDETHPGHRFASRETSVRFVRDLIEQWVVDAAADSRSELPREDLLMAEFGVQRAVLRDALTILADAGVVERRRGSGTAGIGVGPAVTIRPTEHGYGSDTTPGGRLSGFTVEVRSWERRATGTPLVSVFPPGTPGFLFIELRSWQHGVPIAVGSHFVRAPECDLLDRADVDIDGYAAMERAGAVLGDATLTLRAALVDALDAEALRLPAGSPVLNGSGRILDPAGEVVSFFTSRSITGYDLSPRRAGAPGDGAEAA